MPVSNELSTKLERVRTLMDERGIATLWLRRVENVAWMTGGVNVAVNTAAALGVASVVITRNACELWTDTIEAPRLRAEDRLEERGFAFHVSPWYEPGQRPPGDPLGVDDLTTHRWPLDRGPEAYEMFQKKRDGAIKVVLEP